MKKYLIVFVVILVFVSAVQFGIPFYHHIVFKSDLKEVSKMKSNQFRDGEMMSNVKNMAREMNVPLKDDNIILTRGSTYQIEVSWEETVNWLGIYQRTFNFSVDTAEKD